MWTRCASSGLAWRRRFRAPTSNKSKWRTVNAASRFDTTSERRRCRGRFGSPPQQTSPNKKVDRILAPLMVPTSGQVLLIVSIAFRCRLCLLARKTFFPDAVLTTKKTKASTATVRIGVEQTTFYVKPLSREDAELCIEYSNLVAEMCSSDIATMRGWIKTMDDMQQRLCSTF